MKKLITMALAILITAFIAVFASGNTAVSMPPKHFTYQMAFNKIVVSDDINVRLKETGDKVIDIFGTDADIENVDWKIRDGVLYLAGKKGTFEDKAYVTVDVSQLERVTIRGKSTVSSIGPLLSPSLYVYMEDASNVKITNTGKIYVATHNHIDLDVKKTIGDVSVK